MLGDETGIVGATDPAPAHGGTSGALRSHPSNRLRRMAVVSAFFDWLRTQNSPALGALITTGIGGFVAFVVAVVNAIASRLLERAKDHRKFRAGRIAPVQKTGEHPYSGCTHRIQGSNLGSITGSQPMRPRCRGSLVKRMPSSCLQAFRESKINHFTKSATEFAEHLGPFRRHENPAPIEHKLIEAHMRVVELAASDLPLRCEVFVFVGLFLLLRSPVYCWVPGGPRPGCLTTHSGIDGCGADWINRESGLRSA